MKLKFIVVDAPDGVRSVIDGDINSEQTLPQGAEVEIECKTLELRALGGQDIRDVDPGASVSE